jgi:hypothetical protein
MRRCIIIGAIAPICLLAAVCLPGSAAAAITRYVSLAGKDAPPCSAAAPCQHVAYAITQAVAGDTVNVGPGTFNEAGVEIKKPLTVIGAGSGTASAYDPAHDTLIEGTTSARPAIEATASTSFSDLRLEGDLGGFPPFEEDFSALHVQASGTAVTVNVANVVATQAKATSSLSLAHPTIALETVSKGSITATMTGLTSIGAASAMGLLQNEGAASLTLSQSALTSRAEASGAAAEILGADSAHLTSTTVGGTGVGFEINGPGSLSARQSSFTGTSAGILARLNASGEGTAEVGLRDSLAAAVAQGAFGANAGVILLSEAAGGSLVKFQATNSTLAAYGKEASAGLKLESQKAGATAATIANTIAHAADPTSPGKPRDILATGPATVSAESSGYSTVNAASGATITPPGSSGNVVGDPAFVSPSTGNFALGGGSPMLQHGNLVLMEPGELDLAGNPHVQNDCGVILSPDIGAYELPRAFTCPVPPGPPIGLAKHGAPVIGSASMSAPRRAHHSKARAGKLAFTLDEAATVTVVLERLSNGHLRRKACVARARACTRTIRVAVVYVSGRAGPNVLAFPSLKLLKHLKAGRYEIVLTAVNSQHLSSASRSLRFTLR